MKSKNGTEGAIWLIVIIALLLLFLFIYSGVWNKLFGRSVSGLNDQITATKDSDGDSVINLKDKCPCDSGAPENDGCAIGHVPTANENRQCLSQR